MRILLIGLFAVLQTGNSKCNERKAVLVLRTEHKLPLTPPKLGDIITYKCNLSHISTSKLEAVNLTIFVILPPLIKYDDVTEKPSDFDVEALTNGNIKLQFSSLLPKDSKVFHIQTSIAKDIGDGKHHIVVAFETNYQSILIDTSITKFDRYLTYNHAEIVGYGCKEALGLGSKIIKDFQLTASTSSSKSLSPKFARYGDPLSDAWCSLTKDHNPYFQIAFAKKAHVTAVSTWGRRHKNFFVKMYLLSYSDDEENWIFYSDNGYAKEFDANNDQDTEKKQYIKGVTANFIRIHPIKWEFFACMRAEIYGCYIGEKRNCIGPIGMENRQIPIESLSQKSEPKNLEYSRLNHNLASFPYGWSAEKSSEDWLQINLNSLHQVRMLAVMGDSQIGVFYVQTFYLRYSNNTADWSILKDGDGNEKLLKRPETTDLTLIPIIPSITGRIFRFIPKDYKNEKTMRVELYGCMIEEDFSYQQTPQDISRRSVLIDEKRSKLYICSLTSERKMSSCKRSEDGFTWSAISSNVKALLSIRLDTGRLFGIDRKLNIIMSDDFGNNWYSISKDEWLYQIKKFSVKNTTSINDILGVKEPRSNMMWTLGNGTVWGASSVGLHKKASINSTTWTLSALWSCCGQ